MLVRLEPALSTRPALIRYELLVWDMDEDWLEVPF